MSDGLTGQGLLRTLAWAQWFREFGVTHDILIGSAAAFGTAPTALGRRRNDAKLPRYLLPEHEAVMLRVDVPAQEPPLQPLTGPELKAAEYYRAPVPV